MNADGGPVDLAYYCNQRWYHLHTHQQIVNVVYWAHMPAGPQPKIDAREHAKNALAWLLASDETPEVKITQALKCLRRCGFEESAPLAKPSA